MEYILIFGIICGFYMMVYGNALLNPEIQKLREKREKQKRLSMKKKHTVEEADDFAEEVRERAKRSKQGNIKGVIFLLLGALVFTVSVFFLIKELQS